MSEKNDGSDDRPTFWHVLYSILAALFGVQSGANRERDFTKGRPGDYIGVFAVMVVVLIIGVAVVVSLVIRSAGG